MSYPLTRSQSWIQAGQQLLPFSPMNNMAFAIVTPPNTETDHFVAAIKHMIGQCEAMHLQLSREGESWRLRVERMDIVVETVVYPGREALWSQANAACRKRLKETIFRPDEKLYDIRLYKLDHGAWVWYFNQHHLITDGWGKSLQVRYVFDCYEALCAGEPLPPSPFQPFTAYLAGQPPAAANPEYWDAKAAAPPEPPKLYGGDNPDRSDLAERQTFSLGEERAAALDAVITEPDVRNWSADLAKYTVFATVLYAFLYRVSGRRDLTIGTPAHNRVSKADKQTPGLYMELFPQTIAIEDGETFTSLLQKVKAETMDFLRHAKPGGSTLASNRSFNVVLNYINQAFVEPGAEGVGIHWLHSGHTEPGHHLSVQVYDFDDTGIPRISLDVNEAVIGRAFHHLPKQHFLEAFDDFMADRTEVLNHPGTRDPAQAITAPPRYSVDKTVVDLFYAAAAANPDHPAVVSETETLTYAELDARSNQLAHHLIALGVKPETPVAICLDRSVEMMVGLLGIIKAGGAYCPIDPDFPAARIAYLLADTGAEIVVTTEQHREILSTTHTGTTLALDADWPLIRRRPTHEPDRRPRPEELFYILHTSGSTGKPKGVMNQHDGVVHRLLWAHDSFITEPEKEVFLQKTTFCFDVSVGELFWPMSQGMTLVMARPGGHKDDRYLREAIEAYGVTTMHFVPSMLEMFLEQADGMPTLQRIICNGEALKAHHVLTTRQKLPHVALNNVYGPTEAAINVTHWPVPDDWDGSVVPIGKPLPDVPMYILNVDGAHCPVGVPGELYYGGVQVARGYFGKPELTDAAFQTRTLYADATPERVYRSGDLARWLPDGNIEFLGRIDGQVKVRGYRIELGEIEANLLDFDGVRQARVLVIGEGRAAYLAAYVVAAATFDAETAKTFLGGRLPAYMVPARYRVLDEMPLNGSGKIDRKALAGLTIEGPAADEAPATEFEVMIHELWLDALEVDAVGVTTSFHDLGGHSLSAIRLINRVNETFELELAANTVFRFPTIRGLAGHVENVITQLMAEMDDA